MDIKVDINPKEVNDHVVSAIIDSVIGTQIRAEMVKILENMSKSWDNPFQEIVKTEINKEIARCIREEFYGQIKEQVHKHLAEKVDVIAEESLNLFITRRL